MMATREVPPEYAKAGAGSSPQTDGARPLDALAEASERFRAVFDQGPNGIALIRPDFAFIDVNDRLCAMLGYMREELLALTVADVTHPDDLELDRDLALQLMAGDIPSYQVEKRYVRKDGEVIWGELSASLIRNATGVALYGVGMVTDITARKETEEALRESTERLLKAQRVAKMGFLDWNLKTNDMVWSDQIYDLYGVDRQAEDASIGLTMQLVHPDDLKFVEENLEMARKGEKEYDIDHRKLRPDGKVIWVHAQAELVRDAEGNPESLLGTVVDITARKQAVERLQESESTKSALLAAAPDMMFRMDRDGTYLDFIPGTDTRPLVSPEEFIGRNIRDVYPELAEDRILAIGQALTTGKTQSAEYQLERDGKLFFFESRMNACGPSQVLVVVRDVTEHRRAAQKLRQSESTKRALLAAMPDLMFRMARDGTFLDFIQGAAARPLVPREELIGRNVRDVAPRLAEDTIKAMERALTTGLTQTLEYELTYNGQPRSFEARMNACGPGEVLVVARDVTEHRRAEEELRLRNAAIDAAANGIVVAGRDGDIVWVNAAFTALTGYPFKEAVGQNPRLLKSGKHDQPFYKQLWDTVLSGQVWRGEMINRRKDGSFYTEEQTITPVSDERGEITHFIAIKQDITPRKKVEDALRRQQEEQQTILDSVPALIFYKDRENRFLRVNRALVEASGIPREEWEGGSAFDLFPNQAENYWRDDKAVMESGQALRNIIEPMETATGTRWYRTEKMPYRDAGGQIVGIIGFSADITEQNNLEEALLHAREELEGKVERQMVRRNPYKLTFREFTILHLLGAGRSDKEIAAELVISRLTAQKHVSNILGKMDVSSRTEAATRALREGLLD